ncbi:hypothetical protein MRX96_023619 [Rhipicephalus microplus]
MGFIFLKEETGIPTPVHPKSTFYDAPRPLSECVTEIDSDSSAKELLRRLFRRTPGTSPAKEDVTARVIVFAHLAVEFIDTVRTPMSARTCSNAHIFSALST